MVRCGTRAAARRARARARGRAAGLRPRCVQRSRGMTSPTYVKGEQRGGKDHNKWARAIKSWLKQAPVLRAQERNKKLSQVRSSSAVEERVKHKKEEDELNKEVDARWQKGRFVSARWLSHRMRQLVKSMSPAAASFAVDRHWRRRFRIRYKWSLRRITNGKRCSIVSPTEQAFRASPCQRVISGHLRMTSSQVILGHLMSSHDSCLWARPCNPAREIQRDTAANDDGWHDGWHALMRAMYYCK